MTDLFGQKDDILEQQIKCVEREIGMRQRVYPNWINAKKMSAGKAEYEITMMQEVLKSLKQNAQLKELLKECSHIMSIEKDFASCHFEKDKLTELLTEIDEVLK